MCAEQDSNLRRPKSSDLQSDAFDHSAIDAYFKSNKKQNTTREYNKQDNPLQYLLKKL
jgi:hypothetical protein